MILPSIDQIISLHDQLIEAGIRKKPSMNTRGIFPTGEGTLDFILESPDLDMDEDPHSYIVKTVGRVYEGIIRLHPFFDGNKRTSIIVAFEICLMNGFYLRKMDTKKEVEFATSIASTTREEIGLEAIYDYFTERIITFFEYSSTHLWQTSVNCPRCGNKLYLGQRKCRCGIKQLITSVRFKGHLDSYEFLPSMREMDMISRKHVSKALKESI